MPDIPKRDRKATAEGEVEYVCVHFVGFADETAASQVIFRGTRAECQMVADADPAEIEDISHGKPVAQRALLVRRAAEWDSWAAEHAEPPVPGEIGGRA